MEEKEIKKEEKKNIKIAKTVILTLVMIPIIIAILLGIWIIYNIIGSDNVSLKDITEDEKNQIIQLLNLEIENDSIEFKKIATPKVYKDISYKIYFYTSNDENIYTTEKSYNLCINFKKIDNNKYCFDVSSITGKSIEVLEQIINKYKK